MIILNKKALAKKYLIMILEALKLNIITFIALAYNGSGLAKAASRKPGFRSICPAAFGNTMLAVRGG